MGSGDPKKDTRVEKKQGSQYEDSVADEEVETCQCGHGRGHYMVSPVPTYTVWGSFWMNLMGVSSVPIRIDFECRLCKERFDFTTKREELENFL